MHLIDGEFQSDKYPTCPRGKVPLSCKDPMAQDLLWAYAQRRREVDEEFADDLETALIKAGYRDRSVPCVIGRPCARHYGEVHGKEAEELRDGVQRIIDADPDEARVRLIQLLDHVDARDSLAFLEAVDPT